MEIQHFTNQSAAWFDFALTPNPCNHDHEILISKSPLDNYWEITYRGKVQTIIYSRFYYAWKRIKIYKWTR